MQVIQNRGKVGDEEEKTPFDFLYEVVRRNRINPDNPKNYCEIKLKTLEGSDDQLATLTVNDRLKALVLFRRTEFNNVEKTYIEI
jgi:hypothetical protein